MAEDSGLPRLVITAAGLTETTPLLGADNQAVGKTNGIVGETTVPNREDGVDGVGRVEDASEDGDGTVTRGGMPEMAAKMHILLPAIGIGVFLCALDQFLVVATYAKIGSDLNALNNTSWIAAAYFLTLTTSQPLYGKLSDIFGRKECLLFAYVVFGLGCLGCGLAQDLNQIIAARAVSGIGGGGMNAVVSILLSDIVPLRDRGVWQGYLNIIFGAGTATGAPLGGLLADSVGWRWSFIGQAPVCIAAFISVYFILDVPRVDHSRWREKLAKVDFLGAFVLIGAVFSLLVGLDNGSNQGWKEAYAVVPLALSPVLFAAFILIEMKVASHPFAPGHIIFQRSLFACFMANFFGVAGQMPVIFFLPLMYQAVDGLSAVQSGLLLIPGSVAGVSASLGGGFVIRRTGRYYWITVAAYGLLLFSVVPLVLFSGVLVRSKVGTVVAWVLVATGSGSGITTTLVALISNASKADTAVVVACSYLFRSLGTAIGISLQSAVLQQVLRTQLARRLESGDEASRIEERVRQSLDYIKELEPGTAQVVRSCYQFATTTVFAANSVFLVLALVTTFFIKERIVGK